MLNLGIGELCGILLMCFPTTRALLDKYRDLLRAYTPRGRGMVSFFKNPLLIRIPPLITPTFLIRGGGSYECAAGEKFVRIPYQNCLDNVTKTL